MTLYKRALFKRFKTKYAPDEVDKLALLIILAFLTIFGIMGCIEAYASEDEEEVSLSSVSGIYISQNSNVFLTNSGQTTLYAELEDGYIYTLTNTGEYGRSLAYCNEIPAPNGSYQFITVVDPGDTYTFRGNGGYLLFAVSNYAGVSVTRHKIVGQQSAVEDLVDNVGINQIWNVFNDGVSFVGVVVLVAFGIFLIVLAIRKVSKGKSEF